MIGTTYVSPSACMPMRPITCSRRKASIWVSSSSSIIVCAGGILAERVARRSVCAGAGATAEVCVGARAAAAGEPCRSDVAQERAVAVELDDAALADVADAQRQEAGRIDLAVVRDED